MSRPNDTRNKELVLKRKKNPKKWTWAELGRYFKVTDVTAYNIYKRDKDRF